MEKVKLLNDRELQRESAIVLAVYTFNNNELSVFNKQAHHNSSAFYKALIKYYYNIWGDLPSKVGPGTEIRLLIND